MSQEEYAIIGRVLRPSGLNGDLIFQTVDDRCLFENITNVFYISDEGLTDLEIEWKGVHKARSVIHIKGVNERKLADSFRDKYILARVSDLPELPENEYYEFQIAGKIVISSDGRDLGKVEYVIYTGGTDILVLSNNKLVPFCREYIIEITDDFIKLDVLDADTGETL